MCDFNLRSVRLRKLPLKFSKVPWSLGESVKSVGQSEEFQETGLRVLGRSRTKAFVGRPSSRPPRVRTSTRLSLSWRNLLLAPSVPSHCGGGERDFISLESDLRSGESARGTRCGGPKRLGSAPEPGEPCHGPTSFPHLSAPKGRRRGGAQRWSGASGPRMDMVRLGKSIKDSFFTPRCGWRACRPTCA